MSPPSAGLWYVACIAGWLWLCAHKAESNRLQPLYLHVQSKLTRHLSAGPSTADRNGARRVYRAPGGGGRAPVFV